MPKLKAILDTDVKGIPTEAIPINGVDNPTVAPVLSQAANASSTLSKGTYCISYTWVNKNGETLVSPHSEIEVTEGNNISVEVPALPSGVLSANVYMSFSHQNPIKQGNTTTTTYVRSTAITNGEGQPEFNTTYEWVLPIQGNVGVTSLPSLPAGANNIGAVTAQSPSVDLPILSSAARTVGAATAEENVSVYDKGIFFLDVTAASGTSPTLDVKVEGKDPVSGKWFAIASFAQAVGVKSEAVNVPDLLPSSIRVNYVIGGTSPSFTFSIGATLKG